MRRASSWSFPSLQVSEGEYNDGVITDGFELGRQTCLVFLSSATNWKRWFRFRAIVRVKPFIVRSSSLGQTEVVANFISIFCKELTVPLVLVRESQCWRLE